MRPSTEGLVIGARFAAAALPLVLLFFAIDMPFDASKMFGKNVLNFLKLMITKDGFKINWEDDIVKGTCVTHNNEIINERVKTLIQN